MRAAPRAYRVAGLVLAAACLGLAKRALAESPPPRDPSALWKIVSTCVDERTDDYCACPSFARSCCEDTSTPDEAVVWARSEKFVAIRDLKMCGCPAGFVAGLALPRARVTGVEDPRRPEGIWPFAWRVARAKIADEREIGLVINPEDARTQNQMHVHMLRLRKEVLGGLDAEPIQAPASTTLVRLADLDSVFASVAARLEGDLANRGILVVRRGQGWIAVVTHRWSPQAFTVNHCDG